MHVNKKTIYNYSLFSQLYLRLLASQSAPNLLKHNSFKALFVLLPLPKRQTNLCIFKNLKVHVKV